MEIKRRKKMPKYFKNSYHMSIEKQFYAEPVDPLNKKI